MLSHHVRIAMLAFAACCAGCDAGDAPERDATPGDVALDAHGFHDASAASDIDAETNSGPGDVSDSVDVSSGACGNAAACTASGDCGEGEVCAGGCCVPGGGDTPCLRHHHACDGVWATTDFFVCDVARGLCLQRCARSAAVASGGKNCPLSSLCIVGDAEGVVDVISGEVLDGVCLPGDCRGGLFDDGACDGVASRLEPGTTCTDATCSCLPFANQTSFCVAAGTAAVGEACDPRAAVEPVDSGVCALGLMCRGDTCIEPCRFDDETACAAETAAACADVTRCACEPVFDVTSRNRPGACAVSCAPHSSGECPADQLCVPQIGYSSVRAWICVDALAPLLPVGSPCDGELGGTGQCEEGSVCMRRVDANAATCVRTCDLFDASGADLAACDAGELCVTDVIDGLGFCEPG